MGCLSKMACVHRACLGLRRPCNGADGRGCTKEALDLEDELALKAASSLCGGVALSGNTCGALSAGIMVMGMKHGRGDLKEGFASVMKAMVPANKLATKPNPGRQACDARFHEEKAPRNRP